MFRNLMFVTFHRLHKIMSYKLFLEKGRKSKKRVITLSLTNSANQPDKKGGRFPMRFPMKMGALLRFFNK